MKRIVCVCMGVLTTIVLHAQSLEKSLYFKHYSVENGLSQNTVNSILKDKDASLWIGTDDGLNHFNGHEFVIYRNKINDTQSLSHNNVLVLERDSADRLWIGTAGGLNRYNPQSDNFTVYKDSSNSNYFSDMLMDRKRKRIWLASEEYGLKYFDLTTETIRGFKHPALSNAQPSSLAFDNEGQLLVGTLNSGVYKLNTDLSKISLVNATTTPALLNNTVHALLINNQTLWIATEGGLNKMNLVTNEVTAFTVQSKSLKSDLVWSLAMDQTNRLWIGTDGGGLSIFDERSGAFQTYTYSADNPQGISGNTLRTIFMDDEGSTWLGTYNNGVNYFNPISRNFHHYAKSEPVSAMQELADRTMLIGTDGDGLLLFDPVHETVKPVKGILCKKILALHRDKNGGLWMGTFQEGLHYQHNELYKVYKNNPLDSTSLLDNTIWAIAEDSTGNIWLGTENGLCRFDPKTGKFENYFKSHDYKFVFYSSLVHSLLIGTKGRIWFGASSCIGYFNPTNQESHQYSYKLGAANCVSNSIVVSLLEKDGYIWAGTFGGGLNRLNPQTGDVMIFDEEHGLPNNTVFSLEEDDHKNLWMSTNKGIVEYTESQNKFSVYGAEVGILNKTFYVDASYRNSTGELIFGGNNGFSIFNPGKVIDLNQRITAGITGLFDDAHLTKPRPLIINENGALVLGYNESRLLGFNLSAFHYLAPDDENFAYRFSGLEDVWRNIGKQRNLLFTNLDPGTYLLEVKAGVNNQWSDRITKLKVVILTPWWLSIYFKAGVLFLILLSAIAYYKARVRIFRRRQKELERLVMEKTKEIQSQSDELLVQNEELSAQNEQIGQQAEIIRKAQDKLSEANNSLEITVEKRTSELKEAYRELDIFFYRASHDFRRPLTTFMGLAEVAKLTVKEANALELFMKVNDTARNLDKMVNKLQSVSEVGASESVRQIIFFETEIARVYDLFKEDLKIKKIEFKSDLIINKNVSSHPGIIRIILANLVENSIQFATPLHPFIHIKIFDNENDLIIQISDNGEGIPIELQRKVFEMYFKGSEKSTGNGLGLYIVKKSLEKLNGSIQLASTRGEGTSIVIRLPIDE